MSKPRTIQAEKLLSTSMQYRQHLQPQWVSDTQLNYMSQYDFVSYDLEEDRIDLIQKPMPHQVIAVRYSSLIGHRNVRIIYLYKEIEAKDKQQRSVFYFLTLPSFNFSEDYSINRIEVPNKKIKSIHNFVYFSDGQYAIFPVLYEDDSLAIVYMGFVNNTVMAYDINKPGSDPNIPASSNYTIKFDDECLSGKSLREQQHNQLRKCHLIITKQLNQFVFFFGSSIYLFRISLPTKQLVLSDKVQIQEAVRTKKNIKKESGRFIPSQNCVCLSLTKTIIIIKQYSNLLLYYLEEEKIKLGTIHDTRSDNVFGDINCISGSFSSNKLLLSVANKSLLYQYKVDDFQETIQYVNCIDLESEHGGPISKVIMSDTARNAAIFTLSSPENQQQDLTQSDIKRQDILNFSIFKIQLYTELGIPESSLYLKKIKYQNRNKKVSRLVIPKIYQKMYALTGSQVHCLDTHKMSGVFFFDIHPCGFYMVVTYSFNIKIYSLQSNSLTLLYSMSMQQLKKVLYSPDGSSLVIFSSRKLKVLDAYSFQLKQQINEKNYSIIDVIFASKRNSILILYDNGIVSQRSFLDFERTKTYRIFGQAHRKIITLRIDQRNQNIFLLLQDGSIILKNVSNFTSTETSLMYDDDEKISEIYIDDKNNLMFVGTRNGVLRIHSVCLQFQMKDYSQINISLSQITSITCSTLENYVYVGNFRGDITMLKYNPYNQGAFLSKSSKILKEIAPKVAAYFSFEFQLVSASKFQGNSQQNALQDKLQSLIQKMQQHTDSFRQNMQQAFEEKQKQYSQIQDGSGKNVYKDFQAKCKRIKIEIHSTRQRHSKQRKQCIEQYQNKMKELFSIQDQLKITKKQLEKSAQRTKRRQQIISVQEEKIEEKDLATELQKFELFYRKQHFSTSLNDLDEDYRISDKDVLTTLSHNLGEQLNGLKLRCMELNKGNSYLQTAKINILARKVQEQTLEHRISQQLKMLKQVANKQEKKVLTLSKQLKSTEDLIHHIQNKVKNTPNNVISSDKADSDLCSYKIWMKQKAQCQVAQLEQYLSGLQENFQKKSMDMVEITSKIKKNEQCMGNMKKKREQLRQKLKNLKYELVTLQTHNWNLQKTTDPQLLAFYKNKDYKCQFQTSKIKKITSMEKLNQRGLCSENKHIKIHMRKIKNLNTNNAQLLNQYQKLKFENKSLLDKQKQCIIELKKAKDLISEQKRSLLLQGICSERASLYETEQTPFLRYVRHRASKTKRSLKMSMESTAAATPRMTNSRIISTMRSTTSRFY